MREEKIEYKGNNYKVILEDSKVSVTVNDKEVYRIEKEINVLIKDILDEKSFKESQALLFKIAEADIKNGVIEKNAKKLGVL